MIIEDRYCVEETADSSMSSAEQAVGRAHLGHPPVGRSAQRLDRHLGHGLLAKKAIVPSCSDTDLDPPRGPVADLVTPERR